MFSFTSFTLNLTNTASRVDNSSAHSKASGPTGAQHSKVFVTTKGVITGFCRVSIVSISGTPHWKPVLR